MPNHKKRHIKIAWQLLFWFLIIEFPAEVLLTYVSFWKAREALTEEITNNLSSIAERQSKQITNYLAEKERHVNTLSAIPEVQQAFDDFLIGDSSKQESHEKTLLRYKEAFRYDNLFFVSVDGSLRYSSQPNLENINFRTHPTYKKTELAAVFERANILLQSEISDFSYVPFTRIPTAFIAQPIRIEGRIKGVIIAQINNSEINEIVNDYTGLGKSGETMLIAELDEKALLIANLRNKANSAFKLSFEMDQDDSENLALENAVKGQRGSGLDTDYRGQEVIALWSYIPALRAGVVVKVDTAEAFEPIQRLKLILILIIFATLLIVIFAAFSVAQGIAKPIVALTKFAEKVGQGNLDERVDIKSQNEIGKLADSFNQMVGNLKASKEKLEDYSKNLEHKVTERTAELSEALEELNNINEELSINMTRLEESRMTLEVAHRKISDSVQYAQRIQSAVLPEPKKMEGFMPEYFVFYKPRDVVSGDFYWATQVDDKIVLINSDCTGHGVPGAFMSMIGIVILEQIVERERITSPVQIMERLHAEIQSLLYRKKESNIRDGMDMAICTIDTEAQKITFAGAKQHLLLMQNKEVEMIKGAKKSVGDRQERREDIKFFESEIDYTDKETIFYLYSDGFQDQFGGPKNKKYMAKKFRELLVGIASLPMQKQRKRLATELLVWKGKHREQTDDISIIGVRL
ncbi:MAG: SpoIIE family protein phosphatase [Bernardetiaceae bacterium]|nr:SpoIIE family protein phosphatase [Bernardetiaceae bacterium]